jgi:hypothetical protein
VMPPPAIVEGEYYDSDDCFRQAEKLRSEATRLETKLEAEKTFALELWVLVLIALELIASLVTIVMTIRENRNQDRVFKDQIAALTTLNDNASKTLAIAKTQEQKIELLESEQSAAVGKLQTMNDTLQTSLGTTRSQLKILKIQQAAIAIEQAKKPAFEMYLEGNLIGEKQVTGTPDSVKSTNTILNLEFKNKGDKTANRGQIRVRVFSKDVALSVNVPGVVQAPAGHDAAEFKDWLIYFDVLRPQIRLPMIFTFTYPKGHRGFDVAFSVSCDEVPAAVDLGMLSINPVNALD